MYHKLSASTKGLALLKSLGRNHRNNKQNCIMIEPFNYKTYLRLKGF